MLKALWNQAHPPVLMPAVREDGGPIIGPRCCRVAAAVLVPTEDTTSVSATNDPPPFRHLHGDDEPPLLTTCCWRLACRYCSTHNSSARRSRGISGETDGGAAARPRLGPRR